MHRNVSPILFIVLALNSACGDDATRAEQSAGKAPAAAEVSGEEKRAQSAASPGKPSAPIRFRYEVLGNPIVGQPVAVRVFVESSVSGRPINLEYRVNDTTSMTFPESQARRREIVRDTSAYDATQPQQITVVPQREGRLFLNVSAEIVMEDGDILLKSQAIPINVGPAPLELDENGELKETADGETVESLPSN